jgi:adenylate cyclase class IV
MRNVEIKARIQNIDNVILKLEKLSDSKDVIKQHDIFFKAIKGKLKLRRFEVRIL